MLFGADVISSIRMFYVDVYTKNTMITVPTFSIISTYPVIPVCNVRPFAT